MFIIVAVAMYIASRINSEKFIELFAITSLNFTHVFPWRFVTYCFYFGESPIFFFFTILVLMVFATKLESIWGSFYFAIFLILTIVSRSIAAFLFGAEVPIVDWMNVYTSLVIAFGFNFAEDRMYLFFIIPIKMKIFAIIALVMLGISVFNSLFYPLCIQFIQSFGSVIPSEYQTLVEEYYHLQAFYRTGLITVSPMISPFLVKVCSYIGLIIFAPKIFNFDKKPHFLNPKKEQLAKALTSLNDKLTVLISNAEKLEQKQSLEGCPESSSDDDDDDDEDDDDWPDEDEIISQNQHSEDKPQTQPKAESGPLCDEEDFEPDDDYCKTCGSYQQCAARSNIKTHQVDEIV
ncbi:MAG: rhomboid family intramembrane serine protease [Spirochaetales bacterium]|nr:rhomboid family intramembrane serine protease [Spirochaetales bacterium]